MTVIVKIFFDVDIVVKKYFDLLYSVGIYISTKFSIVNRLHQLHSRLRSVCELGYVGEDRTAEQTYAGVKIVYSLLFDEFLLARSLYLKVVTNSVLQASECSHASLALPIH